MVYGVVYGVVYGMVELRFRKAAASCGKVGL